MVQGLPQIWMGTIFLWYMRLCLITYKCLCQKGELVLCGLIWYILECILPRAQLGNRVLVYLLVIFITIKLYRFI